MSARDEGVGASRGAEASAVFDHAPTPALVLSSDGKILRANRAARKLLGSGSEELVGQPLLGFVVNEDRPRAKEFFLQVLQGQRREWTTRFRHGSGALRAQRVRVVPIGSLDRVDSILMFTRDLRARRESGPEAPQLQTLLENLPGQFTAVVDPRGGIRRATGMARTHFRDDVELVGKHYSVLFDVDHGGEALLESLLAAVAEGDHWQGTVWHERVDGVSFPARTFASPYVDPTDGRTLGALIVGRDVSDEHGWRGRAHRAERLAAVGEFAAAILDELGSAVERVRAGDATTDPTVLAPLDAFIGSVREMAADSDGRRHDVELRGVVRGAVARFESRLRAASIDVEVKAPTGVPEIRADPSEVTRLVEIFLENAIESLEGVGRGGWIRIEIELEGAGVVLRVVDSGPPLAEESAHRVFDPFYTTKAGRSGLGLTLARSLVQAHEGRIWSDHDDEGRNVFAVYLPQDGSEPSGRFRPVPLDLSTKRTILVVDDEESVRLSVRRFLEKVGFEVREAWSGRSALAQVTGGKRPEVVITDLRMRDGSGFWFLGEMERDFPDLLRHTIILTGDPDHEEVRRIVEKTGCPLMGKPVEMPELLELLDEISTEG